MCRDLSILLPNIEKKQHFKLHRAFAIVWNNIVQVKCRDARMTAFITQLNGASLLSRAPGDDVG